MKKMNFNYWLKFLVKKLWILILFPLLAFIVTAYVTMYRFDKTYESVSTLYIASKSDYSQLLSKLETVKEMTKKQSESMAGIINSQKPDAAKGIPNNSASSPNSQIQKDMSSVTEQSKELLSFIDSMTQELKSVMVPAGYSELMAGEMLVKDYKELMTSRKVIDEVIKRMHLKDVTYSDVLKRIAVNPRNDTRIIEIRVQDTNPVQAKDLSNTLGIVFSEKLKEIAGMDNARILDEALIENKPVKPDLVKNVMLASLAGFIAAIGLIFLMEYFNKQIRSKEDIERHTKLATLGYLPSSLASRDLTSNSKIDEDLFSSYRVLRTNILNTKFQRRYKTLTVAACSTCDGDPVISKNLALAMSKSGMNVLCISNDHKSLGQDLGHKKTINLADVLKGRASLDKSINSSGHEGFWTINWGENESELRDIICQPLFEQTLQELSKRYDWVIIDATLFTEVSDTAHLATLSDGTLLVAESGFTLHQELQSLKKQLVEVGANIFGVILQDNGKA